MENGSILQPSGPRKSNRRVSPKTLPFNAEAEKAVLGAILLDSDNLSKVSDFLLPEDFHVKPNRIVFDVLLGLSKHVQFIDLVTLQDALDKSGRLDEIGGSQYLLELQEDIPAVGLIEQHAKIVKEKAILRKLIHSAADIIGSCMEQDDERIDEILDVAEKTIFEISGNRTSQSFLQLDAWMKKAFQHMSSIKGRSGITGIPSGYSKLDKMTSGFQDGDLVVLAARPSMGKTALALNIAINAAMNDVSVGLFSLEMAAEQLTLRILSMESGVDHQSIRNVTISSEEWIELTNVAAKLASTKVFIDDTAVLSLMDLRTKARKLKLEGKLDLLVIDYLQLIHSSKRHENRHQEVSEISRSLKALAKELRIPVIALSQLSRAVESRMDKRPMLSDLRESGAIEQDADLIMFMYRDVVYNPDVENPELSELIIGKQRNGPTGTVFMNFLRETTRFEEAEPE